MTNSERISLSSEALEETMRLLQTTADTSQQKVGSDYVDVVGEEDPIGPHRGQQVFHSRFLPLIYERIWRPAVANFFFGRGLKAAEESRITMEMLDLSPGDRVIDVGCGPGNYTRDLARAAGDGLVVGIDASGPMVAAAAKRGGGKNLAYVRGDACALPFGDGAFDAVCCVGVIHMIEDPLKSLDEMVRVLAPGGRLAVVASCAAEGDSPRPRGGVTVFGRDELTSAMVERGLDEIEQQIIRRAQFVAAHKPADGVAVGR